MDGAGDFPWLVNEHDYFYRKKTKLEPKKFLSVQFPA